MIAGMTTFLKSGTYMGMAPINAASVNCPAFSAASLPEQPQARNVRPHHPPTLARYCCLCRCYPYAALPKALKALLERRLVRTDSNPPDAYIAVRPGALLRGQLALLGPTCCRTAVSPP